MLHREIVKNAIVIVMPNKVWLLVRWINDIICVDYLTFYISGGYYLLLEAQLLCNYIDFTDLLRHTVTYGTLSYFGHIFVVCGPSWTLFTVFLLSRIWLGSHLFLWTCWSCFQFFFPDYSCNKRNLIKNNLNSVLSLFHFTTILLNFGASILS